jgi:hypothetical protein
MIAREYHRTFELGDICRVLKDRGSYHHFESLFAYTERHWIERGDWVQIVQIDYHPRKGCRYKVRGTNHAITRWVRARDLEKIGHDPMPVVGASTPTVIKIPCSA